MAPAACSSTARPAPPASASASACSRCPQVALRSLPDDRRKDPEARRAIMREVDLVVLCLPDAAARESVALADSLGDAAPKLLDASTAHRVAPGWVYGFPELEPGQAGRIAAARAGRQPGLLPHRRDRAAPPAGRCRAAAGRLSRHHQRRLRLFRRRQGDDRRARERAAARPSNSTASGSSTSTSPETQLYAGLTRRPIFVPSVGHYRQGMLVSVPLHLDTLPGTPVRRRPARRAGRAATPASALVRVLPPTADGKLEPEALNDTDVLELRVFANEAHRQAVLVARLDNLGKGASGAAVQNIGLMLGLPGGASRAEPAACMTSRCRPGRSTRSTAWRRASPPDAFIAPTAAVIGDVHIGAQSGIWFHCVLRGDTNFIRIGARTNIQDGTIIHVNAGNYPTLIGDDVTVGHAAIIHACTLHDRAFVGMGATVLDGAVIEEGGMLAAGVAADAEQADRPQRTVAGLAGAAEPGDGRRGTGEVRPDGAALRRTGAAVSGRGSAGSKEARPGLCPGPAKGQRPLDPVP